MIPYHFLILLVFSLFMIAPDGPSEAARDPSVQSPTPLARTALGRQLHTFGLVYGHPKIREIERSLAGLLVVDPDAWTASEVARLRRAGRRVIGYLSVGEAEEYRPTFSDPRLKPLLLPENPDWKGNFPVRLGHPHWQAILSDYGRAILAKGFDGLLFDVVDGWEAATGTARTIARAETERLLTGLGKHLRSVHPEALFLITNSDQLFENPSVSSLLDGIIQESLHRSWAEGKIDPAWRREKVERLAALRKRGYFVGLLEYTRDAKEIRQIKLLARSRGFVPYFSDRKLDRLYPIP